jgi:hypothetical protein
MQISFPILDFPNSHPNPMPQKRQPLVETQPEINVEEYEKQFNTTKKIYLIVFVVFTLLLIACFFIKVPISLIIFLIFSGLFVLVMQSMSGSVGDIFDTFESKFEYYNTKQPEFIKKGKITFKDEGISITQNTKNIFYKYKDMTSLNLFYFGISLGEEYKLNSLKWTIAKEENEYIFLVGSYYSRNQLIDALKYLYQQKVEIKEWSENWEALHLLSLPERPESSKEENDKPIDEKYLKMIDEIGKKEDEL